jgi:hypothetical protein
MEYAVITMYMNKDFDFYDRMGGVFLDYNRYKALINAYNDGYLHLYNNTFLPARDREEYK